MNFPELTEHQYEKLALSFNNFVSEFAMEEDLDETLIRRILFVELRDQVTIDPDDLPETHPDDCKM